GRLREDRGLCRQVRATAYHGRMARGSILVFQVGLLGDTLVAMPAIRAIRERFPDRDLVLLTTRPHRPSWVCPWEILGPTGWFSDVVFYDCSTRLAARAREVWRIARELRRRSIETVFNLAPPRNSAQ